MSISVRCPNPDCGGAFKLADRLAGKTVKCPKCGAAIAVTDTSADTHTTENHGVADFGGRACPSCGASLGTTDVFCTECGMDLRSGGQVSAPPVLASKGSRKGPPVLLIVLIVLGVVVLGGAVVGGVMWLASGDDEPAVADEGTDDDDEEPTVDQRPVVRPPVDPLVEEPPSEGEWEIAPEALAALQQRATAAKTGVEGYRERLEALLQKVPQLDREGLAAGWAALYAYCNEQGLAREAARCLYQAVRLNPSDPTVNATLGRTELVGDQPATPQEKELVAKLRPVVTIINSDYGLAGASVRVAGGADKALAWGEAVSLTASEGQVPVEVLIEENVVRSFSIDTFAGVDTTIELISTYAAFPLTTNFVKDFMSVLDGGNARSFSNAKRVGGGLVSVEYDGLVIEAIGADRIAARSARGEVQIAGRFSTGSSWNEGTIVLEGSGTMPLRLRPAGNDSPEVVAVGGVHYVRHDQINSTMWDMASAACGDMGTIRAAISISQRALEMEKADRVREANGLSRGRWESLLNDVEALRPVVQSELDRCAAEAEAFAAPEYLNPLAGSGRLNWLTCRQNLVNALGDSNPLALQLRGTMRQQAYAWGTKAITDADGGRSSRYRRGSDETDWGELVNFDTVSPLAPSVPGYSEEAIELAFIRLLPLMPERQAIEYLATRWTQDKWESMSPKQQSAGVLALERIGTTEAVDLLIRMFEEFEDVRLQSLVTLSLGHIGTARALEPVRRPTAAVETRVAATCALAAAGDPAALERELPLLFDAGDPMIGERVASMLGEMDTPGALLALSKIVDLAGHEGKAVQCLADLGGAAAAVELVSAADKGAAIGDLDYDAFQPSGAAPLLAKLGNLASTGNIGESGLRLLARDGSEAALGFLRQAAANRNDKAMLLLVQQGSAGTLDMLVSLSHMTKLATINEAREKWLEIDAETNRAQWRPGVAAETAVRFLQAVAEDTHADVNVRLTACGMLVQVGAAPPVDVLAALARADSSMRDTPTMDPMREEEPPRGGGPMEFDTFKPSGWSESSAEPLWPRIGKKPARQQLYALGVLAQAGGTAAGTVVRELGYDDYDLMRAQMLALAEIGGDQNLEFLRTMASTAQPVDEAGATAKFEHSRHLFRFTGKRVSAFHALGNIRDAKSLPLLLDALSERAVAAEQFASAAGEEGTAAKWAMMRLQQGALNAIADICVGGTPAELVPGGDAVQERILANTIRILSGLPPEFALQEKWQDLRAAAARVIGRVGDAGNAVHMGLLRGVLEPPTTGGPGGEGPGGMPPEMFEEREVPETVRKAVVEANASMGMRTGSKECLDNLSELLGNRELLAVFNNAVVEMGEARQQAAGLQFVSLSMGRLSGSSRNRLARAYFDAGGQQGQQLTNLVAIALSSKSGWKLPAVERVGEFGYEMGGYDDFPGMDDPRYYYDRHGAFQTTEWKYPVDTKFGFVEPLQEKLQWMEMFARCAPGEALSAVDQFDLLDMPVIGPSVAVALAERSPSTVDACTDPLVQKLQEGRETGPGGMEFGDSQDPVDARDAVCALRKMHGNNPGALLAALIGPRQDSEEPGDMPPAEEEQISFAETPGTYIARALGTTGSGTALRTALNAPGHVIFDSNPFEARRLAWVGMGWLPKPQDSVTELSGWYRRAVTDAQRRAIQRALLEAMRRSRYIE